MEWIEQKGSDFWKPEEAGEELQGEIMGIVVDGQFGIQFTIKTDEGKISVTPSHAVLQSRMRGCKEGDHVRILFDGLQRTKVKGQKDMKLYRVFVAKKS